MARYLRLLLGFRRITPHERKTSSMARWSVDYTTGSVQDPLMGVNDICHVEIIIGVPCVHIPRCKYCVWLSNQPWDQEDEHKFQSTQTNVTHHFISYTVTGKPGEDFVFYRVDRGYPMSMEEEKFETCSLDNQGFQLDEEAGGQPGPWLFYECNAITQREWKRTHRFLSEQLKKPFNWWGFYNNFGPGVCYTSLCSYLRCRRPRDNPAVPLPALKWYQKGCDFDPSLNYTLYGKNGWFCSELATAAVQHLGLMDTYAPGTVSPNALFQGVTKNGRWRACGPPIPNNQHYHL